MLISGYSNPARMEKPSMHRDAWPKAQGATRSGYREHRADAGMIRARNVDALGPFGTDPVRDQYVVDGNAERLRYGPKRRRVGTMPGADDTLDPARLGHRFDAVHPPGPGGRVEIAHDDMRRGHILDEPGQFLDLASLIADCNMCQMYAEH